MIGNLQLPSIKCISTLNFSRCMEYTHFTPKILSMDALSAPSCKPQTGCSTLSMLCPLEGLQILPLLMWKRDERETNIQ